MSIDEARRLARDGSIAEPNTGCWLWLGPVFKTNCGEYAMVGPRGRRVKLTRALLGLVVGDPLQALHTCDTPICVNEHHLYRGTPADNVRDMLARGQYRNPRADQERDQTACKRGHAFTPENTYEYRVPATGAIQRHCRLCRASAARALRRRRSSGHVGDPEPYAFAN